MTRFFKLKYLPVFALFLGGGMALATKSPAPKEGLLVQQWYRTGTPDEPNEDNTWQSGVAPASCQPAEKLCSATFETGYNPNMHSDSANVANAIGSVQTGFILE